MQQTGFINRSWAEDSLFRRAKRGKREMNALTGKQNDIIDNTTISLTPHHQNDYNHHQKQTTTKQRNYR